MKANDHPQSSGMPASAPAVAPKTTPAPSGDASRGEVAIYALGNAEGAISEQVPNILQNVMIVAMQVNPILLGLIMGIKTVWDSVTDPIMAHITDNARTRWGRRRPFILVGGLSRVTFLALFVAFMPSGGFLATNALMEAQKFVNESINDISRSQETAVKAYEQIGSADEKVRRLILERVAGIPESMRKARGTIDQHLPTLQQDADARSETLAARRSELDALNREDTALPGWTEKHAVAQGLVETAGEHAGKARELIENAGAAKRTSIAAEFASLHILQAAGQAAASGLETPPGAQAAADAAFAAAGQPTLDIFAMEKKPAPRKTAAKGSFAKVKEGLVAFSDPRNADQRDLVLYVLVGMLIFTVFTTIFSVPYYALGIELSPSYDGRTRVVTFRAVLSKIVGLVAPWIPVACFSLWFVNALQGLFWVSVVAAVIGIPCTILMFIYTRERTHVSAQKRKEKVNLFRSMWQISKNPDFLRIFALYTFIGLVNGLFAQVGFYLNVYWVMGSALAGAKLGAWVSMLAWALGFLSLPVINWACRRFEKHRVLGFAVVWMAIGTALKWWAMDPAHPEYQFVLPFFFSLGIGSVYTVLPTMMADVTDVDELKHGYRREGMFGAVMAFLMKMTGALVPIAAGAVLVMAGFDPSLEYHQDPTTIFNMRLMYSFIPAIMLLFALLILVKYPLSRARVLAIKAELDRRFEAEQGASQQAAS